jgi:hypothetical protein
MNPLTNEEQINLSKLIRENDTEDNTGKIRRLKHSSKIKEDVEVFLNLKKKYTRLQLVDKDKFTNIVTSHCGFIWRNYTNILNRLLADELNIAILYKFIGKLKEIEDGLTDQHTASVDIGKTLKELYIDSALRREKKYEENEENDKVDKNKERKPASNISWTTFKKNNL